MTTISNHKITKQWVHNFQILNIKLHKYKIIINKVKFPDLLGQGNFGRVWKVNFRGNEVAVKVLKNKKDLADAEKEVAVMKYTKNDSRNRGEKMQFGCFLIDLRQKKNDIVKGTETQKCCESC